MANNKDFKVKNGIQPTVYHEGVGTVVSGSVGYYLAGASYDSKSFSVASQEGAAGGVQFKSDGTKMYVTGQATDSTFQYSLSTPYDVSTASYDSVSFNHTAQVSNANCYDLFFKTDGTQMYVMFGINDTVYQYALSTAWDLSTASYASKNFSVASQESGEPGGLAFSNDGTKMYVVGEGQATVFQYTLSTAWDLSTASYASKSFSVSSKDTKPSGIAFSTSGDKMFISGENTDNIYLFTLSTAFDVTTASFSESLDISAYVDRAWYVALANDGAKMYVGGIGTTGGVSNNTVQQYSTVQTTNTLDLSTGSVFEITPTSDIQVNLSNPADSGIVSQATLLLDGGVAESYDLANAAYDSKSFDVFYQDTTPIGIHISTDGTKMYIIGNATGTVYEYDLSTPYDMSSASYNSVSLSVTSQASSPLGINFKADGTKMYVLDSAVYQYSLSTAWDLSTASYDSKTLTISGQISNARGIQLSNDGTSLFVGSIAVSDGIFQYTLSTAFDISTGSYASKFLNVISQAGEMSDFDFNADGTKVFVVDYDDNDVHQYSLSTAFDISTATYDSVVFNPSEGGASSCRGMTFADSGNKLYQLINTGTEVYQYSTATPATITYPSTLEFSGGTAPTSPAIGETDVLTISTTDGGTTYQAVQAIDGAK